MGESLTRLVQRTLGMAPVVRPVIASLYAPGPAMEGSEPRISVEALPGEGVDSPFPPEDTSLMPPAGTPHRAMFSPAVSEKPRGGDERLEPGPSAPVDHSQDTLGRQPESRAEKAQTMEPHEEKETPREEKPSAVFAMPENPLPALTPSGPEPLIPTPMNGTEAALPAPEDALLSSPGEPPVQQILRPRVVLSEGRSPREVESPMKGDRRREAPESVTAAPTIRVTIGRVEVQANLPPAAAPRSKPARPGPMLSLNDYLKRRDGGH